MSSLAELERAKRRRLQEAYVDLRTSGKGDDDRQRATGRQTKRRDTHRHDAPLLASTRLRTHTCRANTQSKLRNLLLGAAADAGIASGFTATAGSGASGGPQAVRALAAAAAASIAAVEGGNPKRKGGAGGTSFSPTGSSLSPGARTGPGAAARAPPPPGPMDGGFLPEPDPISRLSKLQGRSPSVATAGTVDPTTGAPAAVGGVAAAVLAANTAISGRRGAGGGAQAVAGTAVTGAGRPAGNGGVAAAAKAAAQRYDKYDDDDEVDLEAELPSDVELALMAIKSDLRSHPASLDLPPLALRSQLSCLLTDRSTVERQLDDQRRANRVRMFKLPTGTDEFGILTTSDYRAIVRQAADDAAAAAAAVSTSAASAQPQQAAAPPSGAYGTSAGAWHGSGGAGSRWHVAAEAFLCRVVDRCTDFELSREHLLHLLRTAPPQRQLPQSPTVGMQPPQRGGSGSSAPAVAASIAPLDALEEQVSLLLHLGCLARHTDGDADAYVLAVPGAGKLVKAVRGGRRELMSWLTKRQHQEATEEQIGKLKFRSSCLPPAYHVKDLVGRGAVRRLASTRGHVIKLPTKKATG